MKNRSSHIRPRLAGLDEGTVRMGSGRGVPRGTTPERIIDISARTTAFLLPNESMQKR